MNDIKLTKDGIAYEPIEPTYTGEVIGVLFGGKTHWFKPIKKENYAPKHDWEILCFIWMGEAYKLKDETYFDMNMNIASLSFLLQEVGWNKATIHSVKRLSDGEVFTVGDETNWGKIKGFDIHNGDIRVLYNAIGDWQFLQSLTKVKPKVPLFTTEDGCEMYTGFDGFIYWVNTKIWFQGHCYIESVEHDSTIKYFSTEEKAKEWLLLNKPIEVSYKDLFEFCSNDVVPHLPFTIHTVKEFFKSKITP